MAYLRIIRCIKCGKEFQAVDNNFICGNCHEIEEKRRYKEYITNIRDGKTIEQRIEQFEDWIYRHKGDK